MSLPNVKLLKSVDRNVKGGTIALVDDRDFWMTMRQSLLMQLSMIERRLGIDRRCPHCGNDVLKRNQG